MNNKLATLTAALALGAGGVVYAVPNLQLDADPGAYVGGSTEDVIAGGDIFKLFALVKDGQWSSGQTFYLSVAITPMQQSGPVPTPPTAPYFGTFDVSINGGSTIASNTQQLYWGIPPSATTDPGGTFDDLQKHGEFPTFYYEYAFTSLPGTTDPYNSAEDPGGPGSGSGLSYATFDFDISGLADGYGLHFDLYTFDKDGKITKAPYSHDASTGDIPPPGVPDGGGTLLTLAIGLLGIGTFRRFFAKAA